MGKCSVHALHQNTPGGSLRCGLHTCVRREEWNEVTGNGCGDSAPQSSREKIRPQEKAEEVQQPTGCKKIAKHGSKHSHEELGVIQ